MLMIKAQTEITLYLIGSPSVNMAFKSIEGLLKEKSIWVTQQVTVIAYLRAKRDGNFWSIKF